MKSRRPDACRGSRLGFVALEVLVVGMLVLLVANTAWWVTAKQTSVSTAVVEGARVLDAVRLSRMVVGTEIGGGRAGEDWRVTDDVVSVRAFRGTVVGCGSPTTEGWPVLVSGYRTGDPDKDSLLVLDRDGSWRVTRLARRRRGDGAGCPAVAGFTAELWGLDPPPPAPLVGRFFEHGQYRITGGALRYRRGRSGWQPLTEAGFSSDSRLFADSSALVVRASVAWERSGPGVPDTDPWTHWGRP